MILSSGLCGLLLLLGFVAAVKIDLTEVCSSDSFRCTISDCNEEVLVIDNTDASYPFVEVVFRNCYLPTLPSAVFATTPHLERLFIYKCSLRGIQPRNFYTALNLRSLYLPRNHISELPERVFANLSSVEEIRLTNNRISIIHPKAFAGATKLRVLELNYNKIHELPTNIFANLTELEYIDLSSNDIESMDSTVFARNAKLKTVLLSNNNFAVFESNTLSHLPHLHMVDISANNIKSIRLQSVNILRAQSAQLKSCVIHGSVIKFRASNNQLESISIADKSYVTEIDVHTNKIDSLADFHGMLNLQKLDVSKNPIRNLNTTNTSMLLNLPSLQYLNVANAQLQSLTSEYFMLLGRLTHLDLASNNLKQLDTEMLEPLMNLEKLYFENNHLQSFDYMTFRENHVYLKEMGIFDNDWSQPYLKKMTDALSAKNIKLLLRQHPGEASSEILAIKQTTSHPHHTVYAKTLEHTSDHSTASKNPPASGMHNHDTLIIVTLCVVFLILALQLARILKEENVFTLFNQGIRRTIPSTRLDEEESEPL